MNDEDGARMKDGGRRTSNACIARTGRLLALDLGTKRIGVAVCDSAQTLATPLCVVTRDHDMQRTHAQLSALVSENAAVGVVVGLPLDLGGKVGVAASAMQQEITALADEFHVPVVTVDERMSTALAHKQMLHAGKNSRQRRTSVDGAAAAIILQSFLDGRASSEEKL